MNDLRQIIAGNITELRKSHKITQLELAEELNYTDKAVSKWERGESMPDIQTLKEIADMFGVTVDYLLNENSSQEKEKYALPVQSRYNQIAIVLLIITIVWLVATIAYVYCMINEIGNYWTIFVWAVPVSTFALTLLNMKWGKRKYTLPINSALCWTAFVGLFVQALYSGYIIWLIFIVCAPIQVALVLWSKIRKE